MKSLLCCAGGERSCYDADIGADSCCKALEARRSNPACGRIGGGVRDLASGDAPVTGRIVVECNDPGERLRQVTRLRVDGDIGIADIGLGTWLWGIRVREINLDEALRIGKPGPGCIISFKIEE